MDDRTATTRRGKGGMRAGGSRWGLAILVVAAVAFVIVLNRPLSPLEGWGDDYAQAIVTARNTNRLVLVEFSLAGCPPCRAMRRNVLATKEVRAALAGFVPVELDLAAGPALATRFGVSAAPTYLAISADDKLVSQTQGYVEVGDFVRFLERASQRAVQSERRQPSAP